MLRVLDLFSGGRDHLADNAFCPKVRGRLGIVSRPSQASCFCSTATLHSVCVLDDEQYQELGFLRKIDTRGVRRGTLNRTGSDCHRGRASQPPLRNKRPFDLGSSCRSLTGSRGRSGQSIRQNNAIGLHRPCLQVRTAPHIGGNAALRDRQPSFVSSETSLCIPSNTTSTWRGLLHTRSHSNRSVLGFLP